MKIIVTLRDPSFTEADRDHAHARVEQLSHYFERLTSAEVILSVVANRKHRTRAEFVVHANRGAILVAQSDDENILAAIDRAQTEVKREILRHKERLVDRHRTRLASAIRKGIRA